MSLIHWLMLLLHVWLWFNAMVWMWLSIPVWIWLMVCQLLSRITGTAFSVGVFLSPLALLILLLMLLV
jgi:hypothetical protein